MAKAREVFFQYTHDGNKYKPGYEIPARGQLVIISSETEKNKAIELGYDPIYVIARAPKSGTSDTVLAFGMDVEDEEIIPFANRDIANKIAQKISS